MKQNNYLWESLEVSAYGGTMMMYYDYEWWNKQNQISHSEKLHYVQFQKHYMNRFLKCLDTVKYVNTATIYSENYISLYWNSLL